MSSITDTLEAFFSSTTSSTSPLLRENRLERMNLLLKHLGNPEKSFKAIHIAGSKGKGTTASFLSLFLSQRYKTGLFLSPHVYDIRERFTLSSYFFSDDEYLKALSILSSSISSFCFPLSLGPEKATTFELYTSYAFILFKLTKCEYCIIETGMGGRLDATNILNPIASVITAIEMEHVSILGNTISEIANEKSGIIKKDTPSFLLKQKEEVMSVFLNRAKEQNSPLTIVDPLQIIENVKIEDGIIQYKKLRIKSDYSKTDIRLLDAIYAYIILDSLGLFDSTLLYSSFSLKLPGRMEKRKMERNINLILDGSHTPLSSSFLLKTLITENEALSTLIFSTALDKDWKNMGKKLFPHFKHIIITSTGKWKKSEPEKIYSFFSSLYPSLDITIELDHKKVIKNALDKTDDNETIVSCGSFYLICEIDKALKD